MPLLTVGVWAEALSAKLGETKYDYARSRLYELGFDASVRQQKAINAALSSDCGESLSAVFKSAHESYARIQKCQFEDLGPTWETDLEIFVILNDVLPPAVVLFME